MKLKSGFETRKARVEMLPLIDVVFLLLVFFIYAFLSMVMHHGLKVELPKAGRATLNIEDYIAITIDRENRLFLNKDPIAEEALIPHVQALRAQNDAMPIFINGDKAAGLGTAVKILDLLQTAGFEKISFSCTPDQP
ncbi:ExbD/TolR family protein [Verrucomicrobiota bacterium]